MRAVSLAIACAFLCVSCSANVFKDPITAFDKSVGDVKGTVEQYATTNSNTAFQAKIASLIEDKRRINLDPRKCALGVPAEQCAIKIVGSEETLVAPAKIEAYKLAAAIKTYSANLAKVVNATTGDDLKKANDELSAAIKTLGTGFGAGTDSTFITNIGPFTTLINLITVNLIESRRLDILRQAVNQADGTIQISARNLANLVREQQRAEIKLQATLIATKTKQYNVFSNAMPEGSSAAREALINDKTFAIDTALTGSANLRDLLKSDASKAILAMGTAHSELVKAINSPDYSLKNLYDVLKKFADDAKTAYDTIQKIK